MSLQSCSLRHGGVTKSLADWGVESLRLRTSVGGGDEMSWTCTEPISGEPQFAAFGEVELFDATGTRRFRGPAFWSRDPWRTTYRSPGGNYWLEGSPFVQEWQFLLADEFYGADITRFILCAAGRQAGQDLADVIAAAVANGASMSLQDHDLLDHRNPADELRDQSCLEVVRRLIAWAPYLDYRFNYEGSDIELELFSVLPSGHGFAGLPDNEVGTIDVTLADVMESRQAPRFNPRHDLLINAFKVNWLGLDSHEITVGGSPVPVLAWTRSADEVAAANGAFRRMEIALPLQRGAWNGDERDADELPVENLAKRLGSPYMRLWLDMGWTQKAATLDFSLKPGVLARCTDADATYAGAYSLVQAVEHVMDRSGHSTNVTCGAPNQLGFYDPKITSRLRRVPGDDGPRQYGFERDEEGAGAGTATFLMCEVNVDTGVKTWKRVAMSAVGISATQPGDETQLGLHIAGVRNNVTTVISTATPA